MSIALLVLIYVFSIGLALFFRWRGIRTAYIWFLLVFLSIGEWLLLVLFPLESFKSLLLANWFGIGNIPINLEFVLTAENWPLLLAIQTCVISSLLTGIARLDIKRDLLFWIFQFLFGLFSWLVALAADLWSIIILWTALDLLEILFIRRNLETGKKGHIFYTVIFKFIGSLFLVLNTSLISMAGINPALSNLKSISQNFFLIAIIFHSGIFPYLSDEFFTPPVNSEGVVKFSIMLMNFIVSFSLIQYLPRPSFPMVFEISILLLLIFLIVFFGFQWASKKDSTWHNFMYLAGGFLLFLLFSENSQVLVFWLPALMLPAFQLIFYSHRSRSTIVFFYLMVVMVSGLPFTLTSFAARGFFTENVRILEIMMLVFPALFFSGLFFRSNSDIKDFFQLDSAYQPVYLVGLTFPVLTAGFISVRYSGGFNEELKSWWAGILSLIFMVFLIYWVIKNEKGFSAGQTNSSVLLLFIQKIFSFEWLSRLLYEGEIRLSRIVIGFSGLLEGAGGILWALVFLLLILTILK